MPVIAVIRKEGDGLSLEIRRRYRLDTPGKEGPMELWERVKLFPSDPYSASLEIRNTKKAGLHAVCTSSVSADIYFCHIKLTKDGEYNLVEEWKGSEHTYRMYRVVQPEEETCPVRRAMRKAKVSLRNLRIVEIRDWGERLDIEDLISDTENSRYEEYLTDAQHLSVVQYFEDHHHIWFEGATYVIVELLAFEGDRSCQERKYSITRVYAKPDCDWEALVHEFERTTPRYARQRCY